MFNLLWLEEWWMDYREIIVLCAAAITLVGVVFNLISNNSLSEKAVDRTENAEKALSAEHKALSAEHKALSAEHKELKATQGIVLERTADAKMITQKMLETLTATERRLFEAELKQSVNDAALPEAQRQLMDSAANVGKFANEFSQLAAENAALHQQVRQLTTERDALHQQVRQLTTERDAPATDKAKPAAKLSRQQECHAEEDEDELEP